MSSCRINFQIQVYLICVVGWANDLHLIVASRNIQFLETALHHKCIFRDKPLKQVPLEMVLNLNIPNLFSFQEAACFTVSRYGFQIWMFPTFSSYWFSHQIFLKLILCKTLETMYIHLAAIQNISLYRCFFNQSGVCYHSRSRWQHMRHRVLLVHAKARRCPTSTVWWLVLFVRRMVYVVGLLVRHDAHDGLIPYPTLYALGVRIHRILSWLAYRLVF